MNKPVSFCHQVSFFISFSLGEYTAVVELPEGMHEYKFVVDGQWYHKIHEVSGWLSAQQRLPGLKLWPTTKAYTVFVTLTSVSFMSIPACSAQWSGDLQQCSRPSEETC